MKKIILLTLSLLLLPTISLANSVLESFNERYNWIETNNKNAINTSLLFLATFIITVVAIIRYNKKTEKEAFDMDKRIENKLSVWIWIPIIVFVICELIFAA